MSYAVNDTISFIATFRNPDGSAATGVSVASFSTDAYTKAGASISFPTLSAFAEIGVTGRYRATSVALAAGFYTVVARATGDYQFLDYECGPFEVVTAAQADPVTYIAAGNVTLQSPVLISGLVEIYQGESYAVADGTNRPLEWTTSDEATWPTLTSATIAFVARHDQTAATISVAGSVVTATGATKKVRVELAPTDTAAKPTGEWDYQVIATLPNTHPITLASGEMTLFERLRA